MKSRMRLLLGAVTTLVLAMSVGLLTGCGGSSQSNDELLGAWDNTSLGVSLEFKDDGTVTYYDGFDAIEGTYEWNGYDGHVTLDGKDFDITYDGDDFNLRGLDGEWYVLEYSKAA